MLRMLYSASRWRPRGTGGLGHLLLALFGAIVFLSSASVAAQDLKIGLMPAVDSIPLLIAQEQGFFEDEGIDVELRMFRNQLYRETALQTNGIDGSVSDLINAVYNWRNRTGVQVGSITDGHFALLTAADSGLTTLQVPTRMEMVVAGQIEAALLPEPVTRIAEARGSNILLDSSVLEQTPGVLLFTERARREKNEEIRALYRAYNRAVEAINADPDSFRSAIVRLGEFPPTVEKSMVIPTYERARRPTAVELSDVTDWMVEKGLIESRPSYSAVVASGLLP